MATFTQTMSGDSRYSVSLTVTERTYSVENNTSDVDYVLTATKASGSGYWDNSAENPISVVINGSTVVNTNVSYNFTASTPVTIILASGTVTGIAHNSDGTKTIAVSGSFTDRGNSLGSATASGNLTLTTIPRQTSITSFTVAKRTETSLTFNWATADTIDYVWYSTNNGSNWTGYDVTDGTSGNFAVTGLNANTTYNCKLRVRRKDSQLTTDSGTVTQTTNAYPQFATQPTYNARTETTLDVTYKPNMTVALAQYRVKASGGSYGSWVNINSNNIISGSATSTAGCTFRISSLTANTNYVVQVRLKSTLSDSYTNSNEVSTNMYTYNYPYLQSASNFIIGNNISIKLYNPLQRSLNIYIYGKNSTLINTSTRSINGDTQIGSNQSEITAQYSSIPNDIKSNYTVRIVCSALSRDTTVNGAEYSINTSVCVPTFSDFEYSTSESSLTGNYDTIIKGVTTTTFTISTTNKATHNYGASITKYRLECGDQKEDVTYSSSQSVSGTVTNCSNQTIKVSAIDSRGLETSVTKTVTNFKDYSKPTFRNISADRNDGVEATTKLSFTANYWNGNFGIVNNSIVKVEYRSKLTTSSTYGSYTDIPVSSLTVNNGIVTLSDYLIHANGSSGGFEVGKAYNLEVRIRDGKNTSTYLITTYGYTNITDGNVAFSTFQDNSGQYHIGFNGMPNINAKIAIDGKPYYGEQVYSTEEQVIGAWIDGKPLYMKVITYVTYEVIGEIGNITNINIPHGISNFKQIVNANLTNNNNHLFPRGYYSNNNGFAWNGLVSADSTYVIFRIINDTWGAKTWYITLEYTKTTD